MCGQPTHEHSYDTSPTQTTTPPPAHNNTTASKKFRYRRWRRVHGPGGNTIVVYESVSVVGGVKFCHRSEAPRPSSWKNRCRSVVALKSPCTGRNLHPRGGVSHWVFLSHAAVSARKLLDVVTARAVVAPRGGCCKQPAGWLEKQYAGLCWSLSGPYRGAPATQFCRTPTGS